ncbi:MAG: NAD(P)/FAD-dependent oxidoreductase [Oscillospiraceae bacterium]|nr:NAD(P)/FAD-dependent oxidoreductase [Oscillospiraceae bacterium]
MREFKYKRLFEPVKLGNTMFRNRIFASATGYQDMSVDGILPPEAHAYYERKAIGGAAAVTVGECVVDSKMGRGAVYHTVLDNPFAEHSLMRLTSAVTRHGAIASAELQHAGMYANRFSGMPCGFYAGNPGVAYGPVACEIEGKQVLAMDEIAIEEVISAYANAALFAKKCGFGMVTVHGGHGWLLSQFISPFINTRTDRWGGSIENRMRLPLAVAGAIRKACGAGFPIEMRISGSECHSGGYDIDEGVAIAKMLDGHVDLIHVSAGSHEVEEVFTVTHPSMFLEDGCNVKFAAEIKKHVKTPVATVGALADGELMEEIIASGQADIVQIARGLIADPDLPMKIRAGGEVRKCMRCLHCFSVLLNEGQFYCAINPESGRELEYKSDTLPKVSKKVLVAGGGIAGLQAALTCAERGHNVTLCEKSSQLGGVLKCEKNVPFKAKLDEYIEQQIRLVKNIGVDIRVNTEVTPELAARAEVDVIIAALGARPVFPDIPGAVKNNVLTAEEVYTNPEKAAGRVVILGGGLVGVELAIYLAKLNRSVTIIEQMEQLNDGGNMMHAKAVAVEIDKCGIELLTGTAAVGITDEGVACENGSGVFTKAADIIISAVGQSPLYEQAAALRYSAPEFHQIGDCITPKNIMAATAQAAAVAREIGRR